MPKIQYKEINFRGKSLELINLVNQVVEEYQAHGYELTLRQAYYQLVARGYIPNNERSYKNIGSLINDGRLAGLIDWHSITDRTRNLRSNGHWDNPADVIASASHVLVIGAIGSRNDFTTFYRDKDNEITVKCGCFLGKIDRFLEKVTQTHGDSKYALVYRAAVEVAKLQIDLSGEAPKDADEE